MGIKSKYQQHPILWLIMPWLMMAQNTKPATFTMNHKPNERRRALITLDISSTSEIYSAQQKMRVIVVSRIRLRRLDRCDGASGGHDGHRHPSCGDAQDQSLSFPICWSFRAEAIDQSGGGIRPLRSCAYSTLCAVARID